MPFVARFRASRLLPCVRFLLSILVSAVLGAPFARANGAAIGYDGGSIVPLASPEVRLVREEVDLYAPLTDNYDPGHAECVYVLVNLSRKTHTFAMSFLSGSPAAWQDSEPPPAKVRVRVAGQEAEVRMERASRTRWSPFGVAIPDSLPVWSVTIPARESTVVEIEYAISWSGGSDGLTDGRHLRYYARPAALWAGTIREATFRLHLGGVIGALLRDRPINRDDYAVRLRIEPPDVEWTEDGLQWRRTDWEPDSDFRFGIDWDVPQAAGN